MYTKVVAYFSNTVQPFVIVRKLLAIISSMQNDLHLIIQNQEINTNTKSLILNHYYITNSTSTVIPKRNYNNSKSQKDRKKSIWCFG